MNKSYLYIVLTALAVFSIVITVVICFAPKSKLPVVTPYSPSKGFWKDIVVSDGDDEIMAPAFFCTESGGYKDHIVDSHNGWWKAEKSKENLGSYASEAFAKKYIEDNAECK